MCAYDCNGFLLSVNRYCAYTGCRHLFDNDIPRYDVWLQQVPTRYLNDATTRYLGFQRDTDII